MTAAIYARYSSDNQRPASIEDQIRNCRTYAERHHLTISDEHIFKDEAISGSLNQRPAIDALRLAGEQGRIKKVLVDDLSRLFRNNLSFVNLFADFKFLGITIISVSESISSDDESATLNFGIRGVINEMYLEDLARKTHRGQVGQAKKGSYLGSRPYGYKRPVGVGETYVDSKGRMRAEKFKLVVDPEQAMVVQEIFSLYIEGKSATAIAKILNDRNVPTRQKLRGGWSTGTISGILQNEKYIGRQIWNKTKNVRNPKTGKKVAVPRPVEEWIICEEPEMRIIDDATWEAAQARRAEVNAAFPKGKKGFGRGQKGKAKSNPSALLSGSLRCGSCGGQVEMVSGRHGGYYGCHNARRGSCENAVKIRKKVLEERFVEILKQRVLKPDHFELLCKEIEKAIHEEAKGIPEEIKAKSSTLADHETKLERLLQFIEEGKVGTAVVDRLHSHEAQIETLRLELEALRAAEQELYVAPPTEWIRHKIAELDKLMASRVEAAALAVRRYFGPITLTPKKPEVGREYLETTCRVKVLPITEEGRRKKSQDGESGQGATTFEWWTRSN